METYFTLDYWFTYYVCSNFLAVKDALDKSEVGRIIIKKYGVNEKIVTISDEEIEKELEDGERK